MLVNQRFELEAEVMFNILIIPYVNMKNIFLNYLFSVMMQ